MATKRSTTATPRAAAQPEPTTEPEPEHTRRSVAVLIPEMHVRHVPVPTQVPAVHVPMPEAVRERLPEVTPGRVLWWGGLAVLAATELISWPVAGVVAVGVYVADRRTKSAIAEQAEADQHDGAAAGPSHAD
jgi:hypothetical protein